MLKLSNFDYGLPKDLIAQYPLEKREEARLMVVERSSGSIKHCSFKDISAYFKKNDLLVLNDTKVLACRLIGHKATGGKVEILLTKRKSGSTFDALIQPSRTKVGEKIYFGNEKICGIVTNRWEISFKVSDADRIYELGQVPLPPYIKREPEELDKEYYQTVYANKEGAIASPTAGLHFTKDLLKNLEAAGVNVAYLTLHVGLGTFKPVTSDDITEHKMEPEAFQVAKATQEKIEEATRSKSGIIAVGTTSLRALEAYANGVREGATNLFIYPGYKFKLVNCLLTNFHLPKTTLFMLVCAFGGEELMKKAYQQAVDDKYRFYSYGDAMLII
ncbi:MAG: tRNA preQ1(34) S-adenosylmethionine ribosyltransferase-isomerase QueA [Candidatus Omnitrophota bacterium]